jgi:RNA polymerase sigma factor (sigma-70 family)
MSDPAENAELAAHACRGDVAAFEQLYRRHAARVHALCLRLAGDPALAEDLVQESFVKAWHGLPDFRRESAFGTWLHRIATNVALSALRRRSMLLEDASSDVEAPAPFETANAVSEQLDLERAIACLPPRARAVLVLHDIEGLQHAEIGERMNIAEGTSRALLHQARKALIGRLG